VPGKGKDLSEPLQDRACDPPAPLGTGTGFFGLAGNKHIEEKKRLPDGRPQSRFVCANLLGVFGQTRGSSRDTYFLQNIARLPSTAAGAGVIFAARPLRADSS